MDSNGIGFLREFVKRILCARALLFFVTECSVLTVWSWSFCSCTTNKFVNCEIGFRSAHKFVFIKWQLKLI